MRWVLGQVGSGPDLSGTRLSDGKGELTAVCRKPGLRTARHLSQKKDGGEGKGKSDVPDTHLLNPGKEVKNPHQTLPGLTASPMHTPVHAYALP